MRYGKLWAGLTTVILGSFAILGYFGVEVYRKARPVPAKVVAGDSGRVLFTGEVIKDGQNAWQGLNTMPVHGHTALFGVYGVLGISCSSASAP